MNLNVKIHEGLMQINPAGGLFQHNPITGWPINTPPIEGESLHIYLQDDLTFYNEKIVEIVQASMSGLDLDNGKFIQRKHKTY